MPLIRRRRPAAGSSYEATLQNVLGAPGRRPIDPLALVWAHQIAWAAASGGDELQVLSAACMTYGVPLHAVLAERQRPQPPVIPAGRRLTSTDEDVDRQSEHADGDEQKEEVLNWTQARPLRRADDPSAPVQTTSEAGHGRTLPGSRAS